MQSFCACADWMSSSANEGRRLVPTSTLLSAVTATLIRRAHSSSAAATHVVCQRGRGLARFARSPAARLKTTVTAPWAASTTRRIVVHVLVLRRRSVIIMMRALPIASSASANRDWHALHYPRLSLPLTGKHSVIDGEVAADGVGSGGCSLTG